MRNVTMPNYTKLFSTIVTSTIWQEPDRTRIVWITMLALSDKNGEIHASVPGLARIAGVPLEDCEKALAAFLSPDGYSRTPEHEGRRIAKIDGGWELLNFQKYRLLASTADTLAKNATRQKKWRQRNGGVTDSNAPVTPEVPKAESDSEAKPKEVKKERPSGYNVPECFAKVDGFTAALAGWIESRKKLKKPPTGYAIQLMVNKLAEHPARALSALNKCIASGWQGFEWEWLDNSQPQSAPKPAITQFKLPGHR